MRVLSFRSAPQVILVVIDGHPIPGEYVAGIEYAEVLQRAVGIVDRLVDEGADVVILNIVRSQRATVIPP